MAKRLKVLILKDRKGINTTVFYWVHLLQCQKSFNERMLLLFEVDNSIAIK